MILERPCLLLGLINPSYGFEDWTALLIWRKIASDPRALCSGPCSRFHDSFLPDRLDAVLREGHLRNDKQLKRVSLAMNIKTRSRIDEIFAAYRYMKQGSKLQSLELQLQLQHPWPPSPFITSIGSVQTTSRLTWSLARSDAMVIFKLYQEIK